MKKFFTILTISLLIFSINTVVFAATAKKNYTEREFDILTSDNHKLKAYLSYPKTKMKGYPTIVMLHSLGYNSTYWISLQQKFNDKGFAVLRIDLRGHGKSVYDKSFHQRSWRSFTNKQYSQYPNDVIETIKFIKGETKKVSFENWGIIGGDIGANTAVLVAKQYPIKPKAMVLMAPSMTFKGLYIPVALTEIGNTPILAIASKTDKYAMNEQAKLSKFAQSTFDICNTDSGSSGMLSIKQHPEMQSAIISWTVKYFKSMGTPITKKK